MTTYKSFLGLNFTNILKLVHCFTPWGLTSELKIPCNFCFIGRLEGDIMLSQNVQALVAAGVEKKKNQNRAEPITTRGAVSNKIYLWTNGRVPYIIDSEFGEHEEFIRTWLKACLSISRALPECVGGEEGSLLYELYRYARPQMVFF